MTEPGKPWTPGDLALLRELRESHLPWADVAEATGHSVADCRREYTAQGFPRFRKSRSRKANVAGAVAVRVPDRVLEERETRSAARERRDVTAAFFGDPPPGYSALDQRRAAP